MDPASLSIGVLSAVFQSYQAVTAIYDAYLGFKNFDRDYREIHMCLMIERCRLGLWASSCGLDGAEPDADSAAQDDLLWGLLKMIFENILNNLQEHHDKMDKLEQMPATPTQDDLSDPEFMEHLAIDTTHRPKRSTQMALRKLRFVVRDRQKLRNLVKWLCYLNDSLIKLSPQLEQQSLHRKLKTEFTTQNASEMPNVYAAAVLLEHKDIEQLASARLVVEQTHDEEIDDDGPKDPRLANGAEPKPDPPLRQPSFRMDLQQLTWKGSQIATDKPRALAVYKGEEVIVDWRASEDNTWRRTNPKAFQKRTENLTRLLNQDLRPLNLAILHCVGYLNQGKALTGYAFRLPDHTRHSWTHRTLFDLISQERDARELPDLGDRFNLAKTLVNTILELHSINWMHKNISTKNIVFWPASENDPSPDITRPYLMGFDVSRPNQPFEFSEAPTLRIDDDHYRHPAYRESYNNDATSSSPSSPTGSKTPRRSFKPSYDIHSLGVVLYEIGIWHNVSRNKKQHSARPSLQTYNSDPDLIRKCLAERQLKDLKRHMGKRYSEVVVACLDRGLDHFWDDGVDYDRSLQLQRYLRHFQKKVVDPLAVCNA